MGKLSRKRKKKENPPKTYPLFGHGLARLIRRGVGTAEEVVPWIVRHIGDRRRAYAWLKGEISDNRVLTEDNLAILLCYLFQQGSIHSLDEVWALLNRGPERFWGLMHRLLELHPWGVPPCPGDPPQDCCLQAPIETIAWFLGREVPAFPEGLLPSYGMARPAVLSLLHEGIQRGWAEKKPVLVSGPRTSGMTTLFRQAVACARIALWERQTGRRAALSRCQGWRGSEGPFFAQALYWRDQPGWDNTVWLERLLDPNNPAGIGLGDISPETLNALPVLLFLDDLRPGRPGQALQERLGPNAVVVAGRHGAFVTEDGVLLEMPALQEEDALALMRRYWKVEGLGEAQPLPQEVQRQMMALSGGNLGFVLELLHIARQISPERMSDYLRSARREPVQVQGEVPVAEARAAEFVRGLLQALTPQQQEALRRVGRLPYFAGYGAWELGLLWGVDEGSAHMLLGELVRQGFGVARPGGLQGDWSLSPVMYRWLRRAFDLSHVPEEEDRLLRNWARQVMDDAAFETHADGLARDLPEETWTEEVLGMAKAAPRVPELVGHFLSNKVVYSVTAWRALPTTALSTGEYLLGEWSFDSVERVARQMYRRFLVGVALVVLLLLSGFGEALCPGCLPWRGIEQGLFVSMVAVWLPWWLFHVGRRFRFHQQADRLLAQVQQRWRQEEPKPS